MTLDVLPGGKQEPEKQLPYYQEDFIKIIDEVDDYCKHKSTKGGYDTGFPQMNDALEGLQTGLILIAGTANTGKTAFVMQMAIQVAQNNPEVLCIYQSLDDSMRELIPRAIAHLQRIPINAVKFPARYEAKGYPNILTRRQQGINKLKKLSDRLILRDEFHMENASHVENIGASINVLKRQTDKKIVLFVDNFHDCTSSKLTSIADENVKFITLAKDFQSMADRYDIPIVCTAELKKLGSIRRPIMDDVRQASKMSYSTKGIFLCYNDVGVKGQAAQVYWNKHDSDDKQPILELAFTKNKHSDFKRTLHYAFYPEQSYLSELDPSALVRT